MIKVICFICNKELDEYGGLLFGPPNENGETPKDHLCVECYNWVKNVKKRRQSLDETIRACSEAFEIMQHYCIGCTEMVSEGPRSYSRLIEPHPDGICPRCGKYRYKKGLPPEGVTGA